ncbi:MAG: hypothetical protein JKY22_00040 [Flavobacteriaceae bacterium]|nr:hypothetical protein [Flavobacteriaceae bacterium]
MKEFLYIIRGGQEKMINASPEYLQEHMQLWSEWMGGIAEKGQLVGGQPLEYAGKTLIDSGTKIIDRPLAEGKELIGGYIIVKAETMDDACEIAKGCPGFEHGTTLEVRELAAM